MPPFKAAIIATNFKALLSTLNSTELTSQSSAVDSAILSSKRAAEHAAVSCSYIPTIWTSIKATICTAQHSTVMAPQYYSYYSTIKPTFHRAFHPALTSTFKATISSSFFAAHHISLSFSQCGAQQPAFIDTHPPANHATIKAATVDPKYSTL